MQYRPHRYATQYQITVRTPNGPQRGEVVDVNEDGARLAGLVNLQRGQKIQLDVLSHRIEAVVLWKTRHCAGVQFRPRLSNHQVDTLRHRRDGRSGHQRGQIGFTQGTMY
jgi:hypothetical protein